MMYELRYTFEANRGLAKLAKDEPKAFKKAVQLLEELRTTPPHWYRQARATQG